MHEVLVNRLGGLSLPRKSVVIRLTDRPDMTLDVYRGRKTTKQQQQSVNSSKQTPVCSFQVVPYWGNTQDRRILRTFWDQKCLHTEDASFHIVITSYQLVIQDLKYFQRIKWQYMILDEAQAIKSSSR